MGFRSQAHATARDLSYPHLFPINLVMNYREVWDRCCFYHADAEERAFQWNNPLQLIGAGALGDADEYRKLTAQLTPMRIPQQQLWNIKLCGLLPTRLMRSR